MVGVLFSASFEGFLVFRFALFQYGGGGLVSGDAFFD